jgi:hypothetical protein
MKLVPLLVISGGAGIFFHLLQGFLLLLSPNRQDELQVLWWRLEPKPFFETFASASLAGI